METILCFVMGRKIPVLVPFLFSRVTRPCRREDSALSPMTTRPCCREDKKVPCRAFVCRVTQVVRRGASQLRHGSVRMLKNHDDAGGRFSLFPLPFPWLAQFVPGGAKKHYWCPVNGIILRGYKNFIVPSPNYSR